MRKLLFFFVAAICFSLQLTAQKKVQGKVIDENGAPLSDVSVTLPGSKTGTITTSDGNFSITVPSNATRLVFSSVGRESKEAVIPADNFITLALSRVDKSLEEVIVVAYGQVKKGDFTGSANQVSGDDFKNRGIMNPLNAIVATGPGVQTTAAGGSPGSSPGIRIRGFGSISASDGPLIVVDGIAYDGGLGNLNSDDIETITTLKDASTVALWGSRASNGVIMITTRKGAKNKNNLSIKATQGYSSRGLPEYERVNPFEYYPLMWESMRNALIYPTTGAGQTPAQAAQNATNGIKAQLAYNPFKGIADNDIVRVDGTINPNAELLYPDDLDWAKELIRQGVRNEYVLSYSGGNDKSDYLGSFGFINEKGYLIRSDWRRFTGRLVINTQPQKWIKTGLNISGAVNTSNQASDGSSTGYVNPFFFSRGIGPIYPVYAHNMTTGEYLLDEFGNRIYDLGNMGGLGLGIPNRPSGAYPDCSQSRPATG